MTAVYHITHLDNLAGILARGELWSDTRLRAADLAPLCIAHGNIKDRRTRVEVEVAPFGVVADYVPFYFCPRSPMLGAIHTGIVRGYPGGQSSVLHLVADAEAIEATGSACLHTDGNAASQPLRFYSGTASLRTAVDWAVVNSWSWRNTLNDNDRKRRKQAEFLVHNAVPWTAIARIGVIDTGTANRVRGILAAAEHQPIVAVEAKWYY